ncbi:MAG: hypothetical protein ACKO24_06245 [Leptolyngbyaceae cyanobacterium]
MVQTIAISEKTTLKYLRERFGLERTNDADFFQEWQPGQTPLTDTETAPLKRSLPMVYFAVEKVFCS